MIKKDPDDSEHVEVDDVGSKSVSQIYIDLKRASAQRAKGAP